MALLAGLHRGVKRGRDQPLGVEVGPERLRRQPGELAKPGLARRGVRDGEVERGLRRRLPRLGLRHVGASALADLEAVLRGADLLAKERHVVLAQRDDLPVLDDVEEGGRRIEENALLGVLERRATRLHRGLRLAGVVAGLEAVEDRLRQGEGDTDRCGAARPAKEPAACHPRRLIRQVERGADGRPVAGPGDGDSLVGGPQARALGIQLRIVVVGCGEGCGQRLCDARPRPEHGGKGQSACEVSHRHVAPRTARERAIEPLGCCHHVTASRADVLVDRAPCAGRDGMPGCSCGFSATRPVAGEPTPAPTASACRPDAAQSTRVSRRSERALG